MKPLDVYKSECRHGMGYSVISADYAGIHSAVSYYVPLNECFEVWSLKVRNDSDTARSLTVTGFGEFTNGHESGCRHFTVNGAEQSGNYIAAEQLTDDMTIVITL